MHHVESIADRTAARAHIAHLQAFVDRLIDGLGTGFITFLGLIPAFAVIFAAALSIAAA
jgi:hypothetical protein